MERRERLREQNILTLDNGKKYLLACACFREWALKQMLWTINLDLMQKRLPVFFCRTRIDHSGLTSKLVKEGFSGKIYGTQATKDLAEILLYGALTVILTIFAALYVAKMQRKWKVFFLVYGEYLVQQELSARLNRKGFEKVEMPAMHQEFVLN